MTGTRSRLSPDPGRAPRPGAFHIEGPPLRVLVHQARSYADMSYSARVDGPAERALQRARENALSTVGEAGNARRPCQALLPSCSWPRGAHVRL